MLYNPNRDRLHKQMLEYQRKAKMPETRPQQVRIYWRIVRKIRQELAQQG